MGGVAYATHFGTNNTDKALTTCWASELSSFSDQNSKYERTIRIGKMFKSKKCTCSSAFSPLCQECRLRTRYDYDFDSPSSRQLKKQSYQIDMPDCDCDYDDPCRHCLRVIPKERKAEKKAVNAFKTRVERWARDLYSEVIVEAATHPKAVRSLYVTDWVEEDKWDWSVVYI